MIPTHFIFNFIPLDSSWTQFEYITRVFFYYDAVYLESFIEEWTRIVCLQSTHRVNVIHLNIWFARPPICITPPWGFGIINIIWTSAKRSEILIHFLCSFRRALLQPASASSASSWPQRPLILWAKILNFVVPVSNEAFHSPLFLVEKLPPLWLEGLWRSIVIVMIIILHWSNYEHELYIKMIYAEKVGLA